MSTFTKSVVAGAALAWLEAAKWAVVHGLEMAEVSGAKVALRFAALLDTLLPKLISGELGVKDAERFAERFA